MGPRLLLVLLATVAAVAATSPPAAADPHGSYNRPGLNALVSVADDGSQSDAASYDAQPSADGSVVAFFSNASNLVDDLVSPHGNVYVRDRNRGVTELVSVSVDGSRPSGSSFQPAISGDGRWVAFISYATNLVPGDDADGKRAQVYLRDLRTGTTTRVTNGVDGGPANGGSLGTSLSGDGRLVAYFSHASNLVPDDTNGTADVFVYDRVSGETRRVSVAADGTQADGLSAHPSLSADGSTIAFYSSATNLVAGDDNGARDVFAVSLADGAVEAVSVSTAGELGNYDSFSPDIALSADGRVVAFQSGASNFVAGDDNGMQRAVDGYDVFVRDRDAGTTERVSVTSSGRPMLEGLGSSLSADGRYVAFQSIKPGEDSASFVAESDAFVHDRVTGQTEVVSATPQGQPGRGATDNPRLTADGRLVFFQSDAADLVPGDANQATDIVVRDRGGETTVLDVSVSERFGEHRVTGLVTMSGVALASAEDPADAADAADLRAASVVYRPERNDLLVRMRVTDVATLPSPPTSGVAGNAMPALAAPGTSYGVEFLLGGVPYQVRGSWAGQLAPQATPGFALYRCASTCAKVGEPEGGWGTTGEEVRVSLPVASLALEAGESVDAVVAYTSSGDSSGGAVAALDTIALGDVALPPVTVAVGFAPEGTPPADVDYAATAGLSNGRFTLPLQAAPPSAQHVFARACVADRCAYGSD